MGRPADATARPRGCYFAFDCPLDPLNIATDAMLSDDRRTIDLTPAITAAVRDFYRSRAAARDHGSIRPGCQAEQEIAGFTKHPLEQPESA